MAREEFACVHRLRVRWAEVDLQKVVFNGHYLTYLDCAVAEHWRALSLGYPDGWVALHGCDFFLRKSTLDYLGPAHYDDELEVLVRVRKLGRSSLVYAFEIHRAAAAAPGDGGAEAAGPRPLLTAELVYVCVALPGMQPTPLPEAFRARVREIECTAPEE